MTSYSFPMAACLGNFQVTSTAALVIYFEIPISLLRPKGIDLLDR